MKKLRLFVCENFSEEYQRIIEKNNFKDVSIISYPDMCEKNENRFQTEYLLQKHISLDDDIQVICSKDCLIKPLLLPDLSQKLIQWNYCFHYIASEGILNYILGEGGYIIGPGWLNRWEEHIRNMGFDEETAKQFFQESCNKLVFFDSGTILDVNHKLDSLAVFLGLPYVIIDSQLELLDLKIQNIVTNWQLSKDKSKSKTIMAEAQAKCAEYEAILNILGKIATSNNKREVMEKIKEIFMVILGANEFQFHSDVSNTKVLPTMVQILVKESQKKSLMIPEKNSFVVAIRQKDKLHGIIEVGDFIFYEYIERYLNFALSISEILAVVLTKIENYEEILEQKTKIDRLYNALDQEMQNGQRAHQYLVKHNLPVIEGVSLSTAYSPATFIGGDFSYLTRKGNQLILYISDITGHGLEGTIFGLFVKGCIESYLELSKEEDRSPDKILAYLDGQVRKGGYPSEYAVSIYILVMNINTREAFFSAAGFQNPPPMVQNDGILTLLVSRNLPISPDIPLEAMEFVSHRLVIPEDAFIFLATDGLYEQTCPLGSVMYEERLLQILKHCRGLPAKTISDKVERDFRNFLGDEEPSDDVTHVVLSTTDHVEFTLLSNFKSLKLIKKEALSYYANDIGCKTIALAVHELVANAIEHGNKFDKNKQVLVQLSPKAIVVEDEGDGFDWRSKSNSNLNLDLCLERGRGIQLIQVLAGDLYYNEKGNRVSLILKGLKGEIFTSFD